MLAKILTGGSVRRSRLHDEKGNFVGKNIRHIVPATLSGLLRKSFGFRPELPWISYQAIEILKNFLNPSSRILEFGSGMSTLWYAKHSKAVFSVESNKYWHNQIETMLKKKNICHVSYLFTEDEKEYSEFMSHDKQNFDLIMIDGDYRNLCAKNAINLIRPGGIIYLDNSDKDSAATGGNMRQAETILLRFAAQQGANVRYFTDFAPTQFFVQQGMLLQVKSSM